MSDAQGLEEKVFSIFSNLASTLGYSPIHGKIIGSLLVEGKPLSLSELAKKTHYSSGMISLSLDLLEVLDIIKKIKRAGDRKLYVELDGDLLEILKKAVIIKVKKGITESLKDLNEHRDHVMKLKGDERKNITQSISILEGEIKRLEIYINLLSEIKLP